ncbi:hypothetical protein F5878DRAFT_709561, partial [Lentinula raphanica]
MHYIVAMAYILFGFFVAGGARPMEPAHSKPAASVETPQDTDSDIPSKTSSSRDSHEANKVTTIFTQYDTFVVDGDLKGVHPADPNQHVDIKVDIWFNLEWEELGSDAEHYLSGTAYQKSASLLIIKSSRVAR